MGGREEERDGIVRVRMERGEGRRIGFCICQAEDGIRDRLVTGVQKCALPILLAPRLVEDL